MPEILYVHWNEHEASESARELMDAGYNLQVHWSDWRPPRLAGTLPDAVVISLDRLPSHGRAVAEWFWEARKRRHVPVLFEGGKRDKAAIAREQCPDARFYETGQATIVFERLLTTASVLE